MGVIFDTSVIIGFERGVLDPDRLVLGREQEYFGICTITVSELLHGVHLADTTARRIKRSSFVEKVIENYPIFAFDLSAARVYVQLWASLRRKKVEVGAHDLIIGATAISLGFPVATLNRRDYEKIDGLLLLRV
jgi:predicted nucleic acid-binding protein